MTIKMVGDFNRSFRDDEALEKTHIRVPIIGANHLDSFGQRSQVFICRSMINVGVLSNQPNGEAFHCPFMIRDDTRELDGSPLQDRRHRKPFRASFWNERCRLFQREAPCRGYLDVSGLSLGESHRIDILTSPACFKKSPDSGQRGGAQTNARPRASVD